MKLRTLSLLLALLMVLSVFTSCSEVSDQKETTSAPTASDTTAATDAPSVSESTDETEPELQPDLPVIDFEGETFTMLAVGPGDANGSDWDSYDLVVDEINGDVINDAVYERNLYLADTYKIDFRAFKPSGGTSDEIKTEVQASSGAFDAAMTHIENGANLSQGGFLIDLYDFDYIDTSKPWWDQRAVEDLEVMDSLYFATGDITVTDNDATWVLMFNKQMHENYQLPNLYDLVREDKWYFDTFYDLAAQTSIDMNGDGALKWKDDQFGFLTSDASAYGLLYASSEKFMFNDEVEVLKPVSDVERLTRIIEKSTSLLANKNITFQTNYEGSTSDDLRIMFEEGKGLFYGEVVQCIIRMRSSDTDFGLVPVLLSLQARQITK